MKQKKCISKTIEQGDREWPPSDAAEFMAWFQKRMDDIPPEHRATASIELDSTMRYDSSCATIEFCYTRMETDEEEDARKRQAAAQESRRRYNELRTLAELQAKYGAPKT